MEIKSNQRVFITGKNGSGKSYWIKKQLHQVSNFVFYDPKHEHDEIKATVVRNPQDLKAALDQGISNILYRPFLINDTEFDLICKLIYEKGNIIFIIDEMAAHVSSSNICDWHSILLRLGRKRGIGVWNCTQRTRSCCHNTVLSETDHVISFKLMLETDRKKLAESFDPLFLSANELQEFHWIYYNTREDYARIMNPV